MDNIIPSQKDVDYIPHGIPKDVFKPIDKNDNDYKAFIDDYYDGNYDEYKFIVFYNNRNIKRKMPGDVLLAYRDFVNRVDESVRKNMLLLLHTNSVDKAGTDLKAVVSDLYDDDMNVSFSEQKYKTKILNYIYNSVDVTINLANNEGYGLATAESLMAGTPIVATVTGGLQDQMGIDTILAQEKFDNPDNIETGDWVYPIWPRSRNLQGSPPTPYIFSDFIYYKDATDGLQYWYNLSKEKRFEMGMKGREYLIEQGHTVESMVDKFDNKIQNLLENWEPRQRVYIKSC